MSDPTSPTPRTNVSKWNARYAYANKDVPKPCEVLVKADKFLPASGQALDLACGRGGNAIYLANKGLSVTAWDNSQTAIDWIMDYQNTIAAKLDLNPQLRDVVIEPPEALSFDVIVVSRFLERGLCAGLASALRPKGLLFYQTFTAGLSNPNYLLQAGELPTLFPTLTELYSKESALDNAGFSEAMFVGQKPAHA